MTAALVEPFGLPAGHYGAILADPPWHFTAWSKFKELSDGSKNSGGGAIL